MKYRWLCGILLLLSHSCLGWGFFGHQQINRIAVFLLPPEMLVLFKPQSEFLVEHSVDPDKRRYAVKEEAPRHYIDIDHYGPYPYDSLPRKWTEAVARFGEDSLNKYGIVPWWIQTMLHRLTDAFREGDKLRILKYAAEIGHYIADAHVPLHACSNHNGQYTDQKGIHGFWESRIPELLAEKEWDFFIRPAAYIRDPLQFTWDRVLESAAAADSVLSAERELSARFPADQKYSFEERNGLVVRQYSAAFSRAYDKKLNGMIERRMRQAIWAVASFWYTAWINAGQPKLAGLTDRSLSPAEIHEFESLNERWKNAGGGRKDHDGLRDNY